MRRLKPFAHIPPHLRPHVAPHDRVLALVAEVDTSDFVALLLEPVHDARAQPALVDDDQRGLELLDDADDVPDDLHRVRALELSHANDVTSLPDGDDGAVAAEPRRVYANDDGRALVLSRWPRHGVLHQRRADELVIGGAGELPVDLDVGLVAVGAVFVNDLLVRLLVGALDRARIDDFGLPELPFGVKRFKKVPRRASGVGKRQPKPMRRILSKKSGADGPNCVVDAAGFVKHKQNAVEIMRSGVGVGVLGAPELRLRRPKPRIAVQIALDGLGEPFRRRHPSGAGLEPVGVDGHAEPFGQFRPRFGAELVLGVSRDDGCTANPRRDHPVDDPRHQRALADAAPA